MRVVIIFSLFTQFVFSQQQQQQFLANNISNFNNQNDNNRGNINFSNVIQNSNIQLGANKPKSVNRPTVRVRSVITPVQINRINTNKTPITAQVRRARSRPRPNVQSTIINQPIVNVINVNNSALGNESNPISQMINNDDIQVQNFSNQQQSSNVGNQLDFNVDLSLNLKGISLIKKQSSASSTSSYYNARSFSKKIAKFKRNFFGKLASHKKSKHRLDVCFNWKK